MGKGTWGVQGWARDDERCGRGVYKYPDGAQYDGEWRDDERWGRGVMKYPNDVVKRGVWLKGVFQK